MWEMTAIPPPQNLSAVHTKPTLSVSSHGYPQMQPQAKAITTTALATTPLVQMLPCMASMIAVVMLLDTFVSSVSPLLPEKFFSAAPIGYLLLYGMISAS